MVKTISIYFQKCGGTQLTQNMFKIYPLFTTAKPKKKKKHLVQKGTFTQYTFTLYTLYTNIVFNTVKMESVECFCSMQKAHLHQALNIFIFFVGVGGWGWESGFDKISLQRVLFFRCPRFFWSIYSTIQLAASKESCRTQESVELFESLDIWISFFFLNGQKKERLKSGNIYLWKIFDSLAM